MDQGAPAGALLSPKQNMGEKQGNTEDKKQGGAFLEEMAYHFLLKYMLFYVVGIQMPMVVEITYVISRQSLNPEPREPTPLLTYSPTRCTESLFPHKGRGQHRGLGNQKADATLYDRLYSVKSADASGVTKRAS